MLVNNEVAEFAKRAENLAQEAASIRAEGRDLSAEMKARGIDRKAFKEAVRLSNMDSQERAEYIGNLMLYADCLGVGDFRNA